MRSVRVSVFAVVTLGLMWMAHPAPAQTAAPRVPVIYCTDLFHPHDDPDDHFDLAAIYALEEIDILGIVLDQGAKQKQQPGGIPIRQMNHLTGRRVPWAIGLATPLTRPDDDGKDQPAEFQGGVAMILRLLEESEKPVNIVTVGSLRDVAAAYNRAPELFKEKVARLLLFSGAVDSAKREWNVGLDPQAWVAVMNSDLPVWWVPCFDGGNFVNHGNASYWTARQSDLLRHVSDRVMNYFIYALRKRTDPDPVGLLDRPVNAWLRARSVLGPRRLWCTAVFPWLAGRRFIDDGHGWISVPAGSKDAAGAVLPFEFVPMTARFDARGRAEYGDVPGARRLMRFRITAGDYRRMMTEVTARLLGSLREAPADAVRPPVIRNPVLRGFRPDPSFLRVGDDYYIATSTFEWFPGVAIHHTRDLVHWRLLGHALTRVEQLDLLGVPCSGGVWAPDLTWRDGTFYLVYSNVRSSRGGFVHADNYLVTAGAITGPWSDPVYLHSSGFDGALFHDDDGRTYLMNLIWDHRLRTKSGGIMLQEYDRKAQRLIGKPRLIFRGTAAGGVEAPHIYKHGGYYHLMTAEGGTGYGHLVTMARARKLEGPYELDPGNPILTSRDDEKLPLQKAGHASLVELADGSLFLAYLCARPLPGTKYCPLGRETALQRCGWNVDGWLRLTSGGRHPLVEETAPDLPPHPLPPIPARVEFDAETLPPFLVTLRRPRSGTWLSLGARPGWLRLRGRETLNSQFRVSLVARRAESFRWEATTRVAFQPTTYQQMAGLVCFYDNRNYHYLRVSRSEKLGVNVAVLSLDRGKMSISEPVAVAARDACWLRARMAGQELSFHDSADGKTWRQIGPVFDASKLSDEYCRGFTGMMIGLTAQDPTGAALAADFDFFGYRDLPEQP